MDHIRVQRLHVQIIATDLPFMMFVQTIKYRLNNLHLSSLKHPHRMGINIRLLVLEL